MMYEGDTVRLGVHFKTFDGVSVDPENIKLHIYDKTKLHIESIDITDTDKQKIGVYFYDYFLADELNEFIFEFVGKHNNKPILSRGKVKIKFS